MQMMSSRPGPMFYELVRRLWAYDRDVAGTRLDVFAVRSDPRLSAADNPRFGRGMPVQVRPLTGLVADQEERDARAMWLPFERNRAAGGVRCCSPAGMTWYMSLLSSVCCGTRP